MSEADELMEALKNWTPQAQEKALALLKERQDPPRIWYCHRGRTCDGDPHDGANYPHARGDQWPPEGSDWDVWAAVSGRGSGKTRMGAEWMRKMSEYVPRMLMIGRRGVDVRETMVEGESGLEMVCQRAKIGYTWEPSKKKFTFSNGAEILGFSGEEPASLRGPQGGVAWLDEPAHMPLIEDVWSNLELALRLRIPGGTKILVTSTPLPIKWLKDLLADEGTRVTRVPTYKNLKNLDPRFAKRILKKYEGTRLGRQELHGELLADVEGALWNWEIIEDARLTQLEGTIEDLAATMDRIVVSIDPAGTSGRKSDETGIVVVGRKAGVYYILADESGRYTPERWARRAVDLYEHWHADAIVVERNYGGEMVKAVLDNISSWPRVREVTSRRGKLIRAEPVFSLYEQHYVKHVPGLSALEEQMTEWIPGNFSPDRLDALVHGVTELSGNARPAEVTTASGLLVSTNSKVYRSPVNRPTVRSWT